MITKVYHLLQHHEEGEVGLPRPLRLTGHPKDAGPPIHLVPKGCEVDRHPHLEDKVLLTVAADPPDVVIPL